MYLLNNIAAAGAVDREFVYRELGDAPSPVCSGRRPGAAGSGKSSIFN